MAAIKTSWFVLNSSPLPAVGGPCYGYIQIPQNHWFNDNKKSIKEFIKVPGGIISIVEYPLFPKTLKIPNTFENCLWISWNYNYRPGTTQILMQNIVSRQELEQNLLDVAQQVVDKNIPNIQEIDKVLSKLEHNLNQLAEIACLG